MWNGGRREKRRTKFIDPGVREEGQGNIPSKSLEYIERKEKVRHEEIAFQFCLHVGDAYAFKHRWCFHRESSRKIYKKKIVRTRGFFFLAPSLLSLPPFLERQNYSETLWRNSKSLKKFQVQEVRDGKCLEMGSSQELPPSWRCSLRTGM